MTANHIVRYRDIVLHHIEDVISMKMVRVLIQVPATLKAKLDAQRKGGTTTSWFVRHLIEQHFKQERRKPATEFTRVN